MKRGSGCCAVDIYCMAALTSLSDSVSYITFLFSEWRILVGNECHPFVRNFLGQLGYVIVLSERLVRTYDRE